MQIKPFIVGSGMSGQAIAKALAVIDIIDPEISVEPPLRLARGQPLAGLPASHDMPLLCIGNPHGLHARYVREAQRAGFRAIVLEKTAVREPCRAGPIARLVQGRRRPAAGGRTPRLPPDVGPTAHAADDRRRGAGRIDRYRGYLLAVIGRRTGGIGSGAPGQGLEERSGPGRPVRHLRRPRQPLGGPDAVPGRRAAAGGPPLALLRQRAGAEPRHLCPDLPEVRRLPLIRLRFEDRARRQRTAALGDRQRARGALGVRHRGPDRSGAAATRSPSCAAGATATAPSNRYSTAWAGSRASSR